MTFCLEVHTDKSAPFQHFVYALRVINEIKTNYILLCICSCSR